MRILAAAAVMLAALCGCAPAHLAPTDTQTASPPMQSSPPAPRARPATQAACTAGGGQWTRVCMMGNYACVSPMPDAGKACRDSDECRGVCTVEAAQPETAAVGKCSADDYPCGCKQFVEDGKAQYPICID